jgi:hypothetical protein
LAFGVDDEVRFYDLSSGLVERSVKLTCDDVMRDDKLAMRVDGLGLDQGTRHHGVLGDRPRWGSSICKS